MQTIPAMSLLMLNYPGCYDPDLIRFKKNTTVILISNYISHDYSQKSIGSTRPFLKNIRVLDYPITLVLFVFRDNSYSLYCAFMRECVCVQCMYICLLVCV